MQIIEIGDTVRDTLTDYEGTVIGITQWIYGCRRLTVQTRELKDGRPIDVVSFDEPQVVLVLRGKHPVRATMAKTGGPHSAPTRRPSATRR